MREIPTDYRFSSLKCVVNINDHRRCRIIFSRLFVHRIRFSASLRIEYIYREKFCAKRWKWSNRKIAEQMSKKNVSENFSSGFIYRPECNLGTYELFKEQKNHSTHIEHVYLGWCWDFFTKILSTTFFRSHLWDHLHFDIDLLKKTCTFSHENTK